MRVPKVYLLAVLIIICALLAAGNAQTSAVQTGQQAPNSQDASPRPSNSQGAAATGTLPNSAIIPGQSPSQGQRATPANPPAADQNLLQATAAPQSQAAVPQNAFFEFLFNNVSALNKIADNNDKAGKHTQAAMWRTHDQRAAGLNDAEGEILQEIARDCLRALKEQDAKIHAFLEKDRAQNASGVAIGPTPLELVQLFEDRKEIVSGHIEKLREALGDASFNKLDTYVHSSFQARVIVSKPAPPSTTVIEKSK